MILQLFKKTKELDFERTYGAPIATVWDAWTKPEMLRQWWGPPKTLVPECRLELSVGGEIHIVTEAGEAMGKYQGTRWPMSGTFTAVEAPSRLTYDARSWTEGEEEGSMIHHTNDIALTESDGATTVKLHVTITQIGPKAKLAAFGMKWGYKAQLDKLEALLSA
ncbi:SRPBCC family protein [[Mycobacterium] burgundiense]|uniref:SRPBCC domain-containing protein n=1 Tax=[Mycobacterium] burgundiense TaxID=3064286 RepID=A0ABM9L843_9MYCO|nr:SRPBCC domain-containing protein [Mycolicibacterium sp. MU0053]CAJ1494434.1 SRPBCC domain-containing protein [Mycolicibacterium sp. MU0053]